MLLAVGCDDRPPLREDPFVTRTLPLMEKGRWIGQAVAYGPHRDGQMPGGPSPTDDELREDLRLMLPHWNLLRVYGASGFAAPMLRILRREGLDMKVLLGVWIAPDNPEGNRREVEAAVSLAREYPDIVRAVCVGNETQVSWSAHRCSLNLLIDQVRAVRARVAQPVTSADDFNYWNKPESRLLAAELDFVTLHVHPLWNGQQLEDALPWLEAQLDSVRALHPDREVVLGETGWATAVHDEGEQATLIKGGVGEAEQKIFYEVLRAWAEKRRVATFFFEAFDENWKGGSHADEVEKHWGLFRADRTPKAAMR